MLIVKGNRSHNTAAFTTPYNFCQKKCCHSNARCEGIKISVALSKVIEKMNRSLAFNGLKLDRQTSLIWDHLKDLYDKSKRSERTAVSILKGLWGMNS